MAMGMAKPRVWPEDKATRDWLRDQRKKRRQTKAASKREGQGTLPASTCSTAPASAYRDAEGWVLMDAKGDPTDWPADWPKEINRRFLKSKGVLPVP